MMEECPLNRADAHAIYNSRSTKYKTPYGAVPSGTRVQFTLRPQRAEGFSGGVLLAQFEDREETVQIPLVWSGLEGSQDLYRAELDVGGYVGLIFYTFRLRGFWGRKLSLGTYQLTVYDDTEQVPDWFGQGMSYQIFPDRFCRTGVPDPAGMVGGRWVHQSWEEDPEYRPDEHGEVRNRDFFGGDLQGILWKLPYLERLGVETLYFCPIFEAAENHRYGTADYGRIDPMLGTEEDFRKLCREAHRRGMRVILDGVFNHTGFVSKYFNGDGFYPEPGAHQSWDSPYRSWFQFIQWPDQYESWWGIYSLPAVNEGDPSYREFIFGGEDSVVRRWLRAGADGWRLVVADELPDDFIAGIHQAVRAEKPEGIVIGEVWEDGSNKIAYDVRRKHILGGHCDGLMNYPLRSAILDYVCRPSGEHFMEEMETIRENYPPFAFHNAMNALGTHDTARILTVLGAQEAGVGQDREWRAHHRLSPEELARGKALLKIASALLFAFPGSPTVYYGDEVGMEGFEDPFNRRTFPWGGEDQEMLAWFCALGALRKRIKPLRRGDIRYLAGKGGLLAFTRTLDRETVLCVFNSGPEEVRLRLSLKDLPQPLVTTHPQGVGTTCSKRRMGISLFVPGYSAHIWDISNCPRGEELL